MEIFFICFCYYFNNNILFALSFNTNIYHTVGQNQILKYACVLTNDRNYNQVDEKVIHHQTKDDDLKKLIIIINQIIFQ